MKEIRSGKADRYPLIMTMVKKDLKQIKRHGLPVLLFFMMILLLAGIALFSMASGTFKNCGDPPWAEKDLFCSKIDVRIIPSQWSGDAPANITFDSQISGGEAPFTYKWEFGDGNTSNLKSATNFYGTPGTYKVKLTILDSSAEEEGGEDPMGLEMEATILIGPTDSERPMVEIYVFRSYGEIPYTVEFYPTVTGGVPPYTYSWDFDDGGSSTSETPKHTFERNRAFDVKLRVTDSAGNMTNKEVSVERNEELPVTLLDVVFGFSVLVTMIMIPAALSRGFDHEISKGTVKTLLSYPVGVMDVTTAKLIYSGIVGFIFSAIVVLIPTMGLGLYQGQMLGVFLTAYILSYVTVVIATYFGSALVHFTKRMRIRPTRFPPLFLLYSFFFTNMISGGLATGIGLFSGNMATAETLKAVFAPFVALSPFHQGGLMLNGALGGSGFPFIPVFILPVVLFLVGIIYSKKLWPDIFEKE